VAEELALEQGFRQAGAVHHHKGVGGTRAGRVHGLRHQFFASARLTQQQHAGLRRSDARHQFQHALKGRRAPDQALCCRLALRHAQGLHLMDEVGLLTTPVAQWHEFDVDVRLALGRVMQARAAAHLGTVVDARPLPSAPVSATSGATPLRAAVLMLPAPWARARLHGGAQWPGLNRRHDVYEIRLVMNIVWEIALGFWPLLGIGAVAWLVLMALLAPTGSPLA